MFLFLYVLWVLHILIWEKPFSCVTLLSLNKELTFSFAWRVPCFSWWKKLNCLHCFIFSSYSPKVLSSKSHVACRLVCTQPLAHTSRYHIHTTARRNDICSLQKRIFAQLITWVQRKQNSVASYFIERLPLSPSRPTALSLSLERLHSTEWLVSTTQCISY